jgi:uncharacterized membrane protein SpoIIM required for sporulation
MSGSFLEKLRTKCTVSAVVLIPAVGIISTVCCVSFGWYVLPARFVDECSAMTYRQTVAYTALGAGVLSVLSFVAYVFILSFEWYAAVLLSESVLFAAPLGTVLSGNRESVAFSWKINSLGIAVFIIVSGVSLCVLCLGVLCTGYPRVRWWSDDIEEEDSELEGSEQLEMGVIPPATVIKGWLVEQPDGSEVVAYK